MIISVIAAFIGSGFGSAVRGGVAAVEQRLNDTEPTDETINVSGSLVAGLVAGTVCSVLGRGVRLSFWLGAVLGAAGTTRLDWWVLRRFGVDPERLIAQARAAAEQQAARMRQPGEPGAEEA